MATQLTAQWRQRISALAQRCGPGMLAGITVGDWLRLLRENGFAVDLACWPRVATVTSFSIVNSIAAALQDAVFRRRPNSAAFEPPLFILGHWRSGTTHLHNLLACDDHFVAPTLYQVLFPHSFRLTETFLSRPLSALLAGRRGFDNVRVAFDLPNEDEFAVCLLCLCSPYMSLAFPQGRANYARFLTFKDVSRDELARWRGALTSFVKCLTHRTGRCAVLKSPPHTARVSLLLDVFPGAKFLHVHRHPCAVFQSRLAQIQGRHVRHNLQQPLGDNTADEIIAAYREMHDAFFDQRHLIPQGHYHEIAYEDLACDPIGQLRAAYHELSLGDFDRVRGRMREYVDSEAGYSRNRYPRLSEDVCQRLEREWHRSFDEWGYAACVKVEALENLRS